MSLYKVLLTRDCTFTQSMEFKVDAATPERAEENAQDEASRLINSSRWTDDDGSFHFGEDSGTYVADHDTTVRLDVTEYTIRHGSLASCMTITFDGKELNLVYYNEDHINSHIQFASLPTVVRGEVVARFRMVFNTPIQRRDEITAYLRNNPITLPVENPIRNSSCENQSKL